MQPLPAFITRVAALLAALLAARQAARLAALLAISLWLTPALAWGPYGHQAVGAIADQLIAGTPTAAKVRAVLGSNLQMASVWADCARSVESVQGVWSYTNPGAYKDCAVYENAASQAALIAFVKRNASRCAPNASHEQCRHKAYHFTNISIQRAGYDAALPGAGPSNVVLALGAAITVLQGGKSPPPINFVGQREALRLLTHYVGDLHQPLHVGSVYLTDAGAPMDPATPQDARMHDNAGGNKILLKGWKLHATWDDVPGKTTTSLLAGAGATRARQVPATTGPIANWPATWASESIVSARSAFKGLKIERKAGDQWPATAEEPAYRQSREALQEAQIVKAGARLAQILTTLWP